MYAIIKEPVMNPCILVELFLQSPDTHLYDMEVVNRTIDICRLFKNILYEPLIQIIYGIALESGDFPNSCPIKPVRF